MNSYRKGMMLSLGVISASVDLYAVVPTDKARSTRMLCPTHHEPLKQQYICEQGENLHPVARDEAVRGIETVNGWIIAPDEEKPSAETSKQLELTPVATAVLSERTFEGPAIYYLTPSSAVSMQAWEVLVGILKKGKISLVTKNALGQSAREKLWKLDLFCGYLVMRELVYPEAIRPVPDILHVKVDKKITVLVEQFVENLLTDWDSLDSSDSNARRFDEWMAAGKTVITQPTTQTESSPVPLLEALQEAVIEKKARRSK